MFWGLIMEPNKRYTQTVEKSFHISMASLDPSTNQSNKVTQVMICYDNHNYLLCTLVKDSIYQVPLDLNFAEGTKIAFTCNGGGHVHLTGYLVPEEEDMDFGSLGDEEEEDDDEEVPQLVPAGNQKKRKASPEQANKQGKKKSKLQQQQEEDDDEDESDDDDEDDEDELANGTMEIDSDDDDDEEEDDDEDDEDDSDEVTRVELKPGLLAKQEKKRLMEEKQALQQLKQKASPNQQQQQKQKQKQKEGQNQQQQQKKKDKKEKNKLANGKADGKPEQQQQQQQKKGKEEVAAAAAGGEKPEQKKRTIEGGIQLEEVKVGEGAVAKAGKFVTVYYTGRLKNGKKFDSTTQGAGFKFRLGKGEVIKGWDLGVAGMKVGGKRKLLIPPALAYGARGSPPVIPPNSVLNFEVELRAVH